MTAPIRILSFNLRSGLGMNGQLDIQRQTELIRSFAPDAAGLQEVRIRKELPPEQGNMPAIMGEKTAMHFYFGRTIENDTFEYGIGILASHTSEWVEEMLLPQPDTMEQRTVLVVKIRKENREFYMVNTHLVFEEDAGKVRLEQLQAITDLVREKGYVPAILTGDLNAQPDEECIRYLSRNWGMTDLTEPTFPADRPEIRIDYVAWYPKDAFTVNKFEIVREAEASDHRPVYIELYPAPNGVQV